MTSTNARPRTPSISELQAALQGARNGQFAESPALPTLEADDRTPPEDRLPVTTAPPAGPGVRLLGAHGGSGARCLAAVLDGTRHAAGKQWPTPTAGREQIVLVCRSSQRGLSAAQHHARHFRDGELRQRLDLLGVIVSADAPGRVPPPLRRLQKLLSGAVPILGEIPWQPAWRLGPAQPLAEAPAWLSKLQQALAAAVTR